jgi:hypothetical protein
MRILALDLASVTGYIIGEAGYIWRARSTTVRASPREPEDGAATLGIFLRDKFETSWGTPDKIVVERYLDPSQQSSSREVRITQQLHGALHGIAACYGVDVVPIAAATVRVFCCGRGNAGDRDATKAMVVARAIELGYIAEGCQDDNAADAGLIFHWACFHLAHKLNHKIGHPHQGLPLLDRDGA